jgi:DNA primase
MLYNWHRAWPQASDGLILVEGVWSVMKLAQAGYVNAVALGGTAVSNAQAAQLRQASRLILMLDGDAAGWQAAQRCQTQQLHPQLVTLHLPPEQDPADLSEEALRWLLAPLFPSR